MDLLVTVIGCNGFVAQNQQGEAQKTAAALFRASQDPVLKGFEVFRVIFSFPVLNHPPLNQRIYPLAPCFVLDGRILICRSPRRLIENQAQQFLGEERLATSPAQHLHENCLGLPPDRSIPLRGAQLPLSESPPARWPCQY